MSTPTVAQPLNLTHDEAIAAIVAQASFWKEGASSASEFRTFVAETLASQRSQVSVYPVLVKAYEWSSDYRCPRCNERFNVADDSDVALRPSRGHICEAKLPKRPVEEEGIPILADAVARRRKRLWESSSPCTSCLPRA